MKMWMSRSVPGRLSTCRPSCIIADIRSPKAERLVIKITMVDLITLWQQRQHQWVTRLVHPHTLLLLHHHHHLLLHIHLTGTPRLTHRCLVSRLVLLPKTSGQVLAALILLQDTLISTTVPEKEGEEEERSHRAITPLPLNFTIIQRWSMITDVESLRPTIRAECLGCHRMTTIVDSNNTSSSNNSYRASHLHRRHHTVVMFIRSLDRPSHPSVNRPHPSPALDIPWR